MAVCFVWHNYEYDSVSAAQHSQNIPFFLAGLELLHVPEAFGNYHHGPSGLIQ